MDISGWLRFLSEALHVRKHLLPDVDNQYNLGASDAAWKDAYIDGAISGDAVTSDSYNASVAKVLKTDDDGGLRVDHIEVGNVTGAGEGDFKGTGVVWTARAYVQRASRNASAADWNVPGSGTKAFRFTASNDIVYCIRTTYSYTKSGNTAFASFCEWVTSFYVVNANTLGGNNTTKVASHGSFATNMSLAASISGGTVSLTITNSDGTAAAEGALLVDIIGSALATVVTF